MSVYARDMAGRFTDLLTEIAGKPAGYYDEQMAEAAREGRMGDTIRVDHRTVQRKGRFVIGLAAIGGPCPEHDDCFVEPDEPIVLRHRALVPDDGGGHRVDLSSAEWGCQRGGA